MVIVKMVQFIAAEYEVAIKSVDLEPISTVTSLSSAQVLLTTSNPVPTQHIVKKSQSFPSQDVTDTLGRWLDPTAIVCSPFAFTKTARLFPS
jgi:hypothetical protein